LVAVGAAAAVLALLLSAAALAGSRSPLARAARAAAAAERYTFSGASGSQYASVVAEYEQAGGGRPFGPFSVTLGADTSALSPTSQADVVSIDWPRVVRDGEAVTAHSLGVALPAGDPLALVAAGHAPRATRTDEIGGRQCRRVEFMTAGRAYVAWRADHPGVMPVNADAGGLPKFAARGVMWQDHETGLPCRIWAELDLPRLAGEQAGTGWVDWEYEW
jgi:hypothetical protein